MGIKFHCPNGHKLHVKSFLAGKKGVCPECGIKIVIPEQSEPHRSRQQRRDEKGAAHAGAINEGAAAAVGGGASGTAPTVSPQPAVSSVSPIAAALPNSTQPRPTLPSPNPSNPAPTNPAIAHPAPSSPTPTPVPVGAVPTGAVPTPAYNPQALNPAPTMPAASPHPVPTPTMPTAFGSAPAMGMPVPGVPLGAPLGTPMGTPAVPLGMHPQPAVPGMQAPVMGMPVGQPPGVPTGAFPGPVGQPMMGPMATAVPAAPHAPDPIDENPNATWYVRPPSGGQYGPARGDVMRKWIGEGRVSADSLVWREGWADWLSASAVFPSLNAGAAEEPSSAAPFLASGPATGAKSIKRKASRSRGPSAGTAVAIVIFLALMAVGLLIALFYVLNQTQHSSHKRSTPQHAAARCVEPWCVI